MPEDAEFDAVVAGSLMPNGCTPELDQDDFDFRGIRIQAPTRVEFQPGRIDPLFGAFARLMICGVYCFDGNYLGLREQFLERLVLVAVDAKRHRAFSTSLQAVPNAVAGPDPFEGLMLTDDDWEGRTVTGYFNPNLAEVMPLPADEATYVVYAVLGSYVSNVLQMTVVAQRPT
jgi:hypothetical protein